MTIFVEVKMENGTTRVDKHCNSSARYHSYVGIDTPHELQISTPDSVYHYPIDQVVKWYHKSMGEAHLDRVSQIGLITKIMNGDI